MKSDNMKWGWKGTPCTSKDIYACVGPGWRDLLSGLLRKLFEAGWDGTVYQVKEKFGGLRVYCGNTTEEMDNIITAYEKKSYQVCEECGAPGRARKGGWIKTLCDIHALKVNAS